MAAADWPVLSLSGSQETLDTFHLWTQIVGKVRLELEPMVNHWWQITLYVSARGLTTSLMPAGGVGLEMEFDFIEQRLELRTTEGKTQRVPLAPGSIADFYAATMDALSAVGTPVHIYPLAQEMDDDVPFPEDTALRPYDAGVVHQLWLALVQMHRVMYDFRARFGGKVSPVHFFWGAPDLAVTRFSGRTAPRHGGGVPHCADWIQQMAYSHEVSSCGYWPGGSDEGMFYSYAYPTPFGFGDCPVRPAAAAWNADLGEFLLPYTAVREADDPDATLLSFFQSTYEAAADLADWDRGALEVSDPPWLGDPPV